MNRLQAVVAIVALLLVVGLFFLPKYVVDSDPAPAATEAPGATPEVAAHTTDIPADISRRLTRLLTAYEQESDSEKKLTFADSLAEAYLAVDRFDSAAVYLAARADLRPAPINQVRAGDGYYEAFSYATDPEKSQSLRLKAQAFYEKGLVGNPDSLSVKAKLAMTYLASEMPMRGIMMLREVLEADPNNEQALYSLGIAAVQTGQYERAIERFERLTAVNPNNVQGQYQLAYCYWQEGHEDRAVAAFSRVKELSSDPEVIAQVEGYLQELQH